MSNSVTRDYYSQEIIFDGGESTSQYVGFSEQPELHYVLYFWQDETEASIEVVRGDSVKFLCYTQDLRDQKLADKLRAIGAR